MVRFQTLSSSLILCEHASCLQSLVHSCVKCVKVLQLPSFTELLVICVAQANAGKNAHLPKGVVRQLNMRGVQTFTLSQSQMENFNKALVKAIVTGNVPFSFVENPHLAEACSTVGIPIISRKQLANKWVPLLAKEAHVSNADTLRQSCLVDASSDGWRKKYCNQGAALINIVALLPDRAYFHDAVNCSTMRKDSTAIMEFLLGAARSLVGESAEDLQRLVGWVLDNTKANWRAMLQITEKHPLWIMRGCFAHSQALLMKDFCKYKGATGRNAADRTFGLKWAETCVSNANTIANFLQDSGSARSLVRSLSMSLFACETTAAADAEPICLPHIYPTTVTLSNTLSL